MQEAPSWLDGPESEARPREPRRWLLVGFAAIPWIAVLLWFLVPSTAAPESDGSSEQGETGTPQSEQGSGHEGEAVLGLNGLPPPPNQEAVDTRRPDHAAHPDASQPIPGVSPSPTTRPAREHGPADDHAIAATATLIARAWLTGIEPRLEVAGLSPGAADSYADHVVVEAIEGPESGVAIARVLALLLRETPDGVQALTRRIAVPLQVEPDGIASLGPPWWLPGEEPRAAALATSPETDPAWIDAAAAGLQASGLIDVDVHSLATTDRWPWVADITARTPDGELVRGPVFLRWSGHRFLLSGEAASVPASEAPREVGR